MKDWGETFDYQLPKCIRGQWSHSVAHFQAEHSVQMDVNLMGSAHFQWGVGAAERPTSSSQSGSMDRQRWTGAGLRLAAEGPAVQNSRGKMSDAVTSDSRYKNRRKTDVLTKRQITLTAATSSPPQKFPWSIASMSPQGREEMCVRVGGGLRDWHIERLLMVRWLKQSVEIKQPLNKPFYLSEFNCQSKSVWRKIHIIPDCTR